MPRKTDESKETRSSKKVAESKPKKAPAKVAPAKESGKKTLSIGSPTKRASVKEAPVKESEKNTLSMASRTKKVPTKTAKGTDKELSSHDSSPKKLEGIEKKKTTLNELKTVTEKVKKQEAVVEASSAPRVPRIDALGRSYATGKRKNAIARVWLRPGVGRTLVNGRPGEKYFARPVLQMIINQPLMAANRSGQYDVWCTVAGGGLSGQAGALRHGISRALLGLEPDLRAVLKQGGFLTRDSRIVERKKYGRAKARRRFQFSKR